MSTTLPDLRYPVGRFDRTAEVPFAKKDALLATIAALPDRLRAAVADLDDARLDTPYRDGGWTVRQVVHHVPDSHVNAYIRFKLALTEDSPGIKTYREAAWAELPDSRLPIAPSLAMLEAVHTRWVHVLRAMDEAQYARTLEHPEWGSISLWSMLQLYEWHSRHHLAHVTALRERMGW